MTTTVDWPESLADRYRAAADVDRRRALAALSDAQRAELLTGKPWWFYGRADQFAPHGSYRWWVINAGRGWGKTRVGAEWSADKARRYPRCRQCLVGATYQDARDVMVEGESGLLSVISPTELRGGSVETGWHRSLGEMIFANGSRFKLFSSEKPFRLRGPQHHFGWGDEPSYWADVARGTARHSTWSNMHIGLRLPPLNGWGEILRRQFKSGVRGLLTMTPRLVPLLKVDDETADKHHERRGLLQRDDVKITTGATMANLRNLDQSYYDAVIRPLLGTAIGQQELGGILLEQVEGALWTAALIEMTRAWTPTDPALRPEMFVMPDPTELTKTVVAIDPSGGVGRDEHGVVVASSSGTLTDLHMWVREDYSTGGDPDAACRAAILAAFEFSADAIVYEDNFAAAWIPKAIEATFRDMQAKGEIDGSLRLPSVLPVHAKTSKLQRAVPVRGHYERRRVHHVGRFPVLEGQMTTWVPGEADSPDRLDALVWAITWLYGEGPSVASVASAAGRERRGRRADQPNSRMPAVYGSRGRRT